MRWKFPLQTSDKDSTETVLLLQHDEEGRFFYLTINPRCWTIL